MFSYWEIEVILAICLAQRYQPFRVREWNLFTREQKHVCHCGSPAIFWYYRHLVDNVVQSGKNSHTWIQMLIACGEIWRCSSGHCQWSFHAWFTADRCTQSAIGAHCALPSSSLSIHVIETGLASAPHVKLNKTLRAWRCDRRMNHF